MPHFLLPSKYRDALLGLVLLGAGAALILCPTQSMEAGRQGLQLCLQVIIPSLFPFLVLSALVVELGMVRYLSRAAERLMPPLFRVNSAGACALVLGLVGGYPIGARTAIDLYEKGLCSKTEAQRLLAFCNNSGPAFIFGVVGAGVFASRSIGFLLYFAHISASLCTGILFRFYGSETPGAPRTRTPQFQTTHLSAAFTSSVKCAFTSVWNICAFVVFFTVVIRLLTVCGVMIPIANLLGTLFSSVGLDSAYIQSLLIGLLEVSSGVTSLSGEGSLVIQATVTAFLLGWAGLCVHCQVFSFLRDTDLSPNTYLAGKAIHGTLAALFTALLFRLLSPDRLPRQVDVPALPLFLASASLLWIIQLWSGIRKKRGGKRVRHGL